MKSLIHVASLLYNTPVAIRPEKYEEIRAALRERVTLDALSAEEISRFRDICGRPEPKAQIDDDDEEDDGRPYRMTPEGIAVIPVRGTLLKRNSWLAAASGLSSYGGIRQAATAALKDPQVRAVMFDVDSPGGTTHGCFELSDALYGLRGDKPMWASSNDMCASAAYALASATDRVFVTRTGCVGSIGVFALHCDVSGAEEDAGVKYTYVSAGAKKTDGNPHEPLSKSAKADIQAEVDREYAIFVQTVARNRGFAGADQKKIQGTEAAVFFAENALPLLADEVATYDEALEMLVAKVSGSPLKSSAKLALEPVSGNNAQQTATGSDSKEETAMDEKKRSKAAEEEVKAAAAAAEPDDDEKDDEDDDEDDKKKKPADDDDGEDAKKSRRGAVTEIPVAANAPAKRIAELCQIAGAPELTADYILKGLTVEQVIAKLSARRVKASADNAVHSYVSGDPSNGAGRVSVDQAIQQAQAMSANSGGTLSVAKAMERILRANPSIYEGYMDERDDVISRSPSGRGAALTNYVLNNQRRYMAGLGLSPAIDEVPLRRSMV